MRSDLRYWLWYATTFAGGIAFALLALMGVFIALSSESWGHEAHPTAAQPEGWMYDGFCCQGNTVSGDCQPIPDEAVKPIPGGWQITLKPGDHRLATRVHVFQIEHSKARPSKDGRFHACLYPTEDILRCFYAPPFGF